MHAILMTSYGNMVAGNTGEQRIEVNIPVLLISSVTDIHLPLSIELILGSDLIGFSLLKSLLLALCLFPSLIASYIFIC